LVRAGRERAAGLGLRLDVEALAGVAGRRVAGAAGAHAGRPAAPHHAGFLGHGGALPDDVRAGLGHLAMGGAAAVPAGPRVRRRGPWPPGRARPRRMRVGQLVPSVSRHKSGIFEFTVGLAPRVAESGADVRVFGIRDYGTEADAHRWRTVTPFVARS